MFMQEHYVPHQQKSHLRYVGSWESAVPPTSVASGKLPAGLWAFFYSM